MLKENAMPMQEHSYNDMKRRFFQGLALIRARVARNNVSLTTTSYRKLIEDVKRAKTAIKKSSNDYWIVKRYDVLMVNNEPKLIYPIKGNTRIIQFYITDSELFDVLHKTHLAINHGGRDKMMKELSPKYRNINRRDVELYLLHCEHCQRKQKSLVGISNGSSKFNSRCQVDLIDFQSNPDGEYNFIMVYREHSTKFVVLKPLKSQKPEEVANHLIDIFTLLGAPTILQSENGRGFAKDVVSRVKELWPMLKIVHGEVKHQEESMKRTYEEIKKLVCDWMVSENSSSWSKGLRFIQLMNNRAFDFEIYKSPYEALFGGKARVGLSTSYLPEEMLEEIETEEQLQRLLQQGEVSCGVKEEAPGGDYVKIKNPSAVCCGCFEDTTDALSCRNCDRHIHKTCGHLLGDNIFCDICFMTEKTFNDGMEPEAKKMKMLCT